MISFGSGIGSIEVIIIVVAAVVVGWAKSIYKREGLDFEWY